VEAEETAELNWTQQRLQQIGAAVAAAAAAGATAAAAAAAAAGGGTDEQMNDAAAAVAAAAATGADADAGPLDAAAAAALTPLEVAAAAIAGQLSTAAFSAGELTSQQQYQNSLLASQINLELLGLAGLGLGEGTAACGGAAAGGVGPTASQVPATAEDHQLVLGVERIRVPELLIQPTALAGTKTFPGGTRPGPAWPCPCGTRCSNRRRRTGYKEDGPYDGYC
jgi:hypothetical protein